MGDGFFKYRLNQQTLNKDIKPSMEDLSLYIGSRKELFHMFHSFLLDNHKTAQEIRFPYGKEYGWCVTHRKGKKLICDVFAEAESFTVMIRLSNQQFNKVYDTLQAETKEMIDSKYPCGNGGDTLSCFNHGACKGYPNIVERKMRMNKNWKGALRMEFPFYDLPNTATIICCHIIENNMPILYVSHDEDDGMWQFLCGRSHEADEARLVSLKYVFDLDNSIGVLKNMPYGYIAERKTQEDHWIMKER